MKHIVSTLAAERPHDAILAEEGGGSDRAGAEWRWIIDPLDGTTNYAHGYPRFCVSIGVEHRDRACVGVVYDPLLDELYCALRGEGATLNGRRLAVSRETQFGRALLATGLKDSFRLFEQPEKVFSWWDYRRMAFRRNAGLRIDHVLLSEPLAAICTASMVDKAPRKLERPSDHAPVIAELRWPAAAAVQ